MGALFLVMNGTVGQGGGGGGTGGLTATIGNGGGAVKAVPFFDYGNNTCVAAGGSGTGYTYAWTFTYVFAGDTSTWSTGNAATLDVRVSNARSPTEVRYICTVRDSAGHVAVSNIATYYFTLSGNFGGITL